MRGGDRVKKEIEPFVCGNTITKRFQLANGKIVCEMWNAVLCSKLYSKTCKGYWGYGCKSVPKNFYKGISGYSVD